jgi:hypothetical protein
MGFTTRAGLIVYTREDCRLRKPRGEYLSRGRLTTVSWHHGGPVGPPRMTKKAAVDTWKSWQTYHQDDPDHQWIDIGYHFGIDGRGRLYCGRPPWALPAAVGGHNTGMLGLVFMQDGRQYPLLEAQRETMEILFEKGIPELDVPPTRRVENLGHKEYSGHGSTECPGDEIMRHLAWRRSRYE